MSSKEPSLNIDGLSRTHRTHANGALAIVNGFVVVPSNVFQCKCYFSGKRAVAKASKELVYCSVT